MLLFDVLFAELLTKLDLLVKDISHLFGPLNMLSLLLFNLLFVEFLAEFLNLAPLIIANVRGQILNLHSVDAIGQLAHLLTTRFTRFRTLMRFLSPGHQRIQILSFHCRVLLRGHRVVLFIHRS